MPYAVAHAIATASPLHFWGTAGVVAAIFVGATTLGLRELSRKHLIENTPTARLRSAAQGYVELRGTATPFDGTPIVAPLTGRHCCWYRFRVDQRQQNGARRGGHSGGWTRIDGATSSDIFRLDDETGFCAIDPEGAAVRPSARQVWYGNTRIPPRAPPRESWLTRLAGFVIGGSYRYTEERIDVHDPLYALGFFRTHGGAASPIDQGEDVAAVLREWKRDQVELLRRFDRNGDGQIDAEEWDAVRMAAKATVAAESSGADAPPKVDMLSSPPNSRRPYILAAGEDEDAVRRRHGQTGALFLGLGVAVFFALAWALTVRLA